MKKNMILTGLLAAMVFLTTAYVMHIPVGVGSGYIHLGDTVIYLAAVLLPTPYAIAAAAIGGGLADLMSGAAVWMIPTVIIKSLMVLPFTAKKERMLCLRNGLAPIFSGLIGVAGYFVAEIVILCLSGSAFGAAVAGSAVSILPNGMQEIAGGAAFLLLAVAMDRLQLKKRLMK